MELFKHCVKVMAKNSEDRCGIKKRIKIFFLFCKYLNSLHGIVLLKYKGLVESEKMKNEMEGVSFNKNHTFMVKIVRSIDIRNGEILDINYNLSFLHRCFD